MREGSTGCFASTWEAATKGAGAGRENVRHKRAALVAGDAENALRARLPGEREMISLFKM